MTDRIRILIAAASLTTLLAGCADDRVNPPAASSETSPGSTPEATESKAPGRAPAPNETADPYDDSFNFSVTTFDGDTFELAEHKGTPVVINFWESW